jgi:hypothetical protein
LPPQVKIQGAQTTRAGPKRTTPTTPTLPAGDDEAWGQADSLRMLLYGESGSGKTTLASRFPDPLLWIICSGGNRPGELKSIDTPENRTRITPRVIRTTQLMRGYLEEAADGRYATVVLDHATGLADLILKEILGLDDLPVQKGWGTASQQQYAQLSLQCKEIFRAILNLPTNVVIIAQQRTFGGKDDGGDPEILRPTVGAALTPSVTGWLNPACDYVCQMFKRPRMDRVKTSVGGKDRWIERRGKGVEYCLRVEPHDVFMTKFRIPGGVTVDSIVNPDYDKLAALINGQPAIEQE